MTRMRVEGLMAAFPKLVGHSKQHTFVETDTVRYVYQPMENHLYLLLITTKASNIVEDLGTLRLLAKVIPDVAGAVTEPSIHEHAFELIFAFDEVLTAGGYKEEATLTSIRNNLLMDSHEEKMAIMIENEKKAEAKRLMDQRAKDIQKIKMDNMKNNFMNNGAGNRPIPGKMEGFGGGGHPDQANAFLNAFHSFEPDSSNSNKYSSSQSYGSSNIYNKQPAAEPEPPRTIAKGMALGKSKKKDSVMAAMAAEDNFSIFGGTSSTKAAFSSTPVEVSSAPSTPLTLAFEEKIHVNMNREGGVESCEVKGTLTFTAHTDAGTAAVVAVTKPAGAFTFATHPKVNKVDYDKKGLLSLKGNKPFPLNRPVGILRWSHSGDEAAPLSINCWPEEEGSGSINVNIEFELLRSDMTLTDVNVLVPLGATDPPSILSIDGQYKCDNGMMCWHHDLIDQSNSSGSIEFSIPGMDVDAFFPVQISFQSKSLLCPIDITNVTSTATGASIPNTITKKVLPETYVIQ